MDAAILKPVGGTMPVDHQRQGSEVRAARKQHRMASPGSGLVFGVQVGRLADGPYSSSRRNQRGQESKGSEESKGSGLNGTVDERSARRLILA